MQEEKPQAQTNWVCKECGQKVYTCIKCGVSINFQKNFGSQSIRNYDDITCKACLEKERAGKKEKPINQEFVSGRPYRFQTQKIGREDSILQPYKRIDGKVQINEKFVKKYGSKALKEFAPEAAEWYKKKKGL